MVRPRPRRHWGKWTEGHQRNSRSPEFTSTCGALKMLALIGIDIDDLCYVTEPRLGLANAPFWLDSAEYHATASSANVRFDT